MTTKEPAEKKTAPRSNFGEGWRDLAENQRKQADHLGKLAGEYRNLLTNHPTGVEAVIGLKHLTSSLKNTELMQASAIHSAKIFDSLAIAWDDMITAGGPDNSRAYVEYEATRQRQLGLLPTFVPKIEK